MSGPYKRKVYETNPAPEPLSANLGYAMLTLHKASFGFGVNVSGHIITLMESEGGVGSVVDGGGDDVEIGFGVSFGFLTIGELRPGFGFGVNMSGRSVSEFKGMRLNEANWLDDDDWPDGDDWSAFGIPTPAMGMTVREA